MAGQQQQDKVTGFKTVVLFKDQSLGIGAYGALYKAKCDDLLCAAKIIHQRAPVVNICLGIVQKNPLLDCLSQK